MDRTVVEIGLNLLKCLDCLSEPWTYGKNLNKLSGHPNISALLKMEDATSSVLNPQEYCPHSTLYTK